jgi:hypothetical protein
LNIQHEKNLKNILVKKALKIVFFVVNNSDTFYIQILQQGIVMSWPKFLLLKGERCVSPCLVHKNFEICKTKKMQEKKLMK